MLIPLSLATTESGCDPAQPNLSLASPAYLFPQSLPTTSTRPRQALKTPNGGKKRDKKKERKKVKDVKVEMNQSIPGER